MKINVITFGCRLNSCESEAIEAFLKEIGEEYSISDQTEITLINTCAVTAEAERKLRQTIRKLITENQDAKIILTGCAAQLHSEIYANMGGVIGIVPNESKLSKEEYRKLIADVFVEKKVLSEKFEKKSKNSTKNYNQQPQLKKVRGFLQIQNGCDQKCTYCVVRFTRGPNISFEKEDIVKQARNLIEKGYKDIILTGVNISAYGRDMNPRKNLAYIVDYILKEIPNLRRLGFSSLDPADIDDDLINLICNEERILPHIHESIQSGDDMILKRMMRRHSRQQVIEINKRILERRPEIVFGADIICGFPTETDEMFENTKALMREGHITLLHAFPYSKRPGTPAARMPGVDHSKAKERVRELKLLAKKILEEKLLEFIGKQIKVLAEDDNNAKTSSFLKFVTKTSEREMEAGKEYWVVCEEIAGEALVGKLL